MAQTNITARLPLKGAMSGNTCTAQLQITKGLSRSGTQKQRLFSFDTRMKSPYS
ncbi:hypothetical protein [Desulfovibrio subterraneus]|uniref:Uncharacterized protein n=1 Tax=Desulfovibrio subterraneus TaxID=2718620 RepID=A0A7J0BGL3_9BACT|nr:hypothetical protein [Desulfovibrio subterraneus]GFM32245.1 hypothetical protein DSM101010T_06100 [Desulfovibrio subterraneus]